MNKKYLIILLIGTLIVVGILLFSKIFLFEISKYNVDSINNELRRTLIEDLECSGPRYSCEGLRNCDLPCSGRRGVIYPDYKLNIRPGKIYGLAFGFINTNLNRTKFSWNVESNDDNVINTCGISELDAENWIIINKEGIAKLNSKESYVDLIKIKIPKNQIVDKSKCITRFSIKITSENGIPYSTQPFDVDVI
jgi:hypothetical protein